MATARADLKTVISADMSQFDATMRRAAGVARTTAGKMKAAVAGASREMLGLNKISGVLRNALA